MEVSNVCVLTLYSLRTMVSSKCEQSDDQRFHIPLQPINADLLIAYDELSDRALLPCLTQDDTRFRITVRCCQNCGARRPCYLRTLLYSCSLEVIELYRSVTSRICLCQVQLWRTHLATFTAKAL